MRRRPTRKHHPRLRQVPFPLTSPPRSPILPVRRTLLKSAAGLAGILAVEQHLEHSAELRRARVVDELPVVLEQLAMLLGAGYSLGSALNRLARRGNGAVAADLQRVLREVDSGNLAISMKSASEPLRDKIYAGLSKRAAESLRDQAQKLTEAVAWFKLA